MAENQEIMQFTCEKCGELKAGLATIGGGQELCLDCASKVFYEAQSPTEAEPWLDAACPAMALVDCSVDPVCSDCQGTGKKESWAWTRCPGCIRCNTRWTVRVRLCRPYCDGSGWVLDVTLEKVLDELEAVGYNVHEFFQTDGVYVLLIGVLPHLYEGEGPTRLAAALDALRQAREVTDAGR